MTPTRPGLAPKLSMAPYAVLYALRFASKKELEHDFAVPPLEGLGWAEPRRRCRLSERRGAWTMMIMQPDWIGADIVTDSREAVGRMKELPALPGLRIAWQREGLPLQIVHIGSYEAEGQPMSTPGSSSRAQDDPLPPPGPSRPWRYPPTPCPRI